LLKMIEKLNYSCIDLVFASFRKGN